MTSDEAIVHRYDHALSFDRVTAACAACEGHWPCDLAGHKGFFTYSAIHDQEGWRCAPDCEHEAHNGSTTSIPSNLIDRLADDYRRWRNGDLNALVFPAIVAEVLHATGRDIDLPHGGDHEVAP